MEVFKIRDHTKGLTRHTVQIYCKTVP